MRSLLEASDRLANYLGLSGATIAAIAARNEAEARQALARVRSQRDIVRLTAALLAEPDATGKDPKLEGQCRQALQVISGHDQQIQKWLQSLQQPDAELLATAAGVQRLVDLALPLEWNVLRDLVVLLGAGSELVALELVRRGQQRLFVYWPHPSVPRFPAQAVVVRDQMEFRMALLNENAGPLPNSGVFRRFPDAAVSDEDVEAFKQIATENLNQQHSAYGTIAMYGELWVTQGIKNLHHIAASPPVNALYGAFAGRPAVVVSPGPSLQKNIEVLSTLKGRALILTSVQSIAPLAKVGLAPDLALMSDPVDMSYLLDNFSPVQVGNLALALNAHSRFFEFGAPAFTFSTNSKLDAWIYSIFGDDSRLASGGSVSCSAFSLAILLGCDPIVLCGQDLSFPRSGEMYIASSPHAGVRVDVLDDGKIKVDYSSHKEHVRKVAPTRGALPAVELPGYYGGTVLSNGDFAMFHSWFENMMTLGNGRRRVFNCTEGGAFIRGMEHVPLKQVLAAHMTETFDIATPFARAQKQDFSARSARALAWVKAMTGLVASASVLAKKCAGLALDPTEKNLGELRLSEADLSRALAPLPFLSIMKPLELFEALDASRVATTLQSNLDASLRLYSLVIRAGELLLPLLEAEQAKLQARSS